MRLRTKDIEEAESCRFLRPRDLFSADGTQNWLEAKEALAELGITRIEPKKPWSPNPRLTTAYAKVLRTGAGFEDKHDEDKAETGWHEHVHYLQRQAIGRHRFNAQYLFVPRRRWALEMPAHRQQITVAVAQGATSLDIEKFAWSVTAKFERGLLDNGYAIPMTRADENLTRRLLMEWGRAVRR